MRDNGIEVIVVDGGSRDQTTTKAESYTDQLITAAQAGRASQMNRGAEVATGEILWFLHSDTVVSDGASDAVSKALSNNQWGRFDIHLSGDILVFRVIERLINLRSCWSGIATGDQGIFLHSALFEKVGGFPDIPLMEDVAISKLLKKEGRPVCLKQQLITSSRRWEECGVIKTVFLMWWLRLLYWAGVSPKYIAQLYR